MRKKFTMLLASLFLVMGTAWAENVLFNANSTTVLPGTLENSQYTWKSSEMTAPDGFTTLRLTFMKTTNNATDPGGHPHVNIAEFYLYDETGAIVELTTDKFSSNATETNEGKSGLHRLCDGTFTKQEGDGNNDWYWHSLWSRDAEAYHYLEINVAGIPNLSTFAVGYVTRQENGSPTELLVTTGSSTQDVAAQCPNVIVTYNHLLGGVSKKTEARDAVVGASYPAPSLPWGVKVVTDLSGAVTEGGTKDIEVAYNDELPFTPSASFETAHWHYLRFTKDARYIRYNETDTYIPTDLDKIYPNVDPEAYAWAFVGDPYTGEYKLMNRKAGSTKVLSSTRNVYDGNTGANTCPLMKEESGIDEDTDNKTWIVTKSTSIAGVNGMFIGLRTSNDETKYMNNRGKLAFWTGGQGDGSTFQTEEFSYEPAFVVAKEEALKSLQALAAIASDKTETAKTAIEALNPTTSDEALAAFTTLNEQMNSVVGGEYFTLCNKNNTSIYLTTDGTNASATNTVDIKAYWTLKNKNGLFYLYNKYNNAYLQRVPTTNETKITITSQENLAAAYRAVLPTAENNVWALTSFESAGNGDTKFIHKAGDNRIVRWNATAEASQWTITEVDYAAAFSALVAAQLDGKVFNDNPALGEYPTSAWDAFDALKEAYLTNPTDENELALVNGIDELEKAKNRPVFTINGAGKDYAKGKSVYDDNDGAPAFKTTDVYDKTMWWALDQVETTVSATGDNYIGIYNVGTGNGFWGQSSIKIAATNDAKEGVFLFYTPASGSTVHFQQNGSTIVYYNSTGSETGSATSFTYLGNSYDLSKLTDEKIAALQALKTAVDEKSYLTWLEPGTGVGQYDITTEEYNAIVGPIHDASNLVYYADLTEKAGYEVSQIEAFTTAVNAAQFPAGKLGTPVVGKYYRIKGANDNAAHYLTGNVTVNGNHIALQEDKTDATIFRYVNNKLLAVESNLYVAMTSNFYTFQILEKNAPNITFAASSRRAGAYTINSGRYFHYNSNNTEGTFLDRCSTDPANHPEHDWCLEEVDESEVPTNTNLLTDINNLSSEASYRIYGDRGFIYVADGALKSTYDASVAYNPRSENHHFAVVTIGGNKYLYNVGAKKFVTKSGNTVTLTDYPEHAITVEAAEEQSTDYDWVISLNGSKLNQSTGSGHAYGIFTNHETEDEGNRWALYKVDTFNPAEASSIKKVTVNYNVEGQTFTKNYGVAASNAISFDYDFATVTSCKVGEEAQEITDGACSVTIQDNVTISVEIDETLPFEAARVGNNIPASAWLYLQMHSNNKKYIEYLSENQKIEWADASVERAGVNTHSWALVGNVVEGFKLVNYAATTSKALKSTGSGSPAMDSYANGTAFVLANTTQSVDGGFCLQYPGGNYLNAGATLQHWGSADAGSTLVATKSPAKLLDELNTLLAYAATVVTIENDNTAALTTAKETAQGIYDATIQYSEEIEGAYEPLNTAIDNVIKAEVDSRLFRLKHSASENLYMTIVTPEAAAGIKIMGKAVDATKQAFYIAATENLGVYNIKSTENYFMASSGAWNYGAYETANENGRAHNVEYLGEGKYALKTLNGYAGTNDGAITAESPLYSNHPKTRTTIKWELEELPKSSITYIYKYGEEEITREVHENVYEGLAAPATAVTLPFGFSYDNAALPTTKGAGNEEVVITCTLSLPFEYASEYANITKWYYLKIHATNQNYLYYDSNNAAQLDATKKEVDAANKDAYTWAFIGDPIHGFQVVNKLSTEGNLLYLNATETNPSVGTETHVWALTSSTYATDGFFMACSTEGAASAERLNKNLSAGIVKYWDDADGGSTFVVEERDLSGASELQEYINNVVNPLLTELGDGTATAVGYVTEDSYEALVAAKAVAQTAVDNKENVNEAQIALQEAVHGLKTIQPTAGTYYFIQNTNTSAYMSVVAGTGLVSSATAGLGELFQFVAAADGKFYLYNVERGTYLSTAQLHGGGQNSAGAVETTSAKAVTITNLGATNEVSIIPDGGATMHHDSNQGTIVGWNGEKGSKSSWKIVEADLTGLTRTVTVGALGYSTLYLNYATIVPEIEGEDNGVYVASEVASNYVALTLVEAGDVLPAKTGVIIKTTPDSETTCEFAYTSQEGSVTSEFKGSLFNEIITPEGVTCYILANDENGVGLYKASKNRDANGNKVDEGGVAFLNNANKVYLPVPVAEPQAAQALAFRFRGKGQGTTEIEVPATNDQQPAVIYDLTGRRITEIVEKGIYIVNGKKVIIK